MPDDRKRILLVEDDPIPRKLAVRVLGARYDVTTVETAHAAIESMRGNHFDLVITDCEMPGMTGLQLVQHVRDENPALPCLMVSGGLNDERRAWLRSAGMSYLEKPYQLSNLLASIRRLIG